MGGRVKGDGGKGFVAADWQVAYNIVFDNGIEPYLESEPINFERAQSDHKGSSYAGFHSTLPSHSNQEKELIKKDLVQNLSKEAKDVIYLLFKSPVEVLKDLMPLKYKGTTSEAGEIFSKERIRLKLISEGWKPNKINKAFQEIRVLVSELDMA